jgi:EAL domain-containing protein (putative c-di-GMP-specific phosphodiesterase class I)
VETTEQAHMLRLLGAERAQGFLYCRPLPLDDLCDRIRANGGDFTPRNG